MDRSRRSEPPIELQFNPRELRARLKHFWSRIRALFWQKYHFVVVDEEPETLRSGIVYVVGTGAKPWAAALKCPCGCREIVWLNLLDAEDRPVWEIAMHPNQTITVYPSVWRTVGCRSHFSLWRGKIIWAPAPRGRGIFWLSPRPPSTPG